MGLIQTPPIKLQIQVITVTRNHESILRIDYPSGATFFRFISSAFDNKKIDINPLIAFKHYTLWTFQPFNPTTIRSTHFCRVFRKHLPRVNDARDCISLTCTCQRERERESLCISLCCASMWLVYGRTRSWWSRKVEKTDSRESMLSIRSIYGTWTLTNQPVHPFPSIPCTLLTDNYYFPLLKRARVYIFSSTSKRGSRVVGKGGAEEAVDAKACQTVITCNYRFRWAGEGEHNRRKGIASRREF